MKLLSPVALLLLLSFKAAMTEQERAAVKKELAEMVVIDQVAARVREGKYASYTDDQWKAFQDSVFRHNQHAVERIFVKYGYPGSDKIGKEGAHDFWLLVQHCDDFPAFQTRVLKAMDQEVKKGNAAPYDYAYLYDRVQVNARKKQRFGTQVSYEISTTGRALPTIGLLDSAHVDSLRRQYGLGPLKEQLNAQTMSHYEMNKEYYQGMKIMQPNLYP